MQSFLTECNTFIYLFNALGFIYLKQAILLMQCNLPIWYQLSKTDYCLGKSSIITIVDSVQSFLLLFNAILFVSSVQSNTFLLAINPMQ